MREARAVAVGTTACLAVGVVTALLLWAGPGLGPPAADATVEPLLVWGAAWLAWACVLWLALGALLVVATDAPGALGRLSALVAAAVTPRAFRRAVEVALGATLVTGPLAAPAALAAPKPGPAHATSAALVPAGPLGTDDVRAGLPSLDRPAPAPSAAPAGRAQAVPGGPDATGGPGGAVSAAAAPAEVVVRRGDTLWDLAARDLAEAAGNAEIARAWPRWYAANRAVIGRDPDVLRPGQRLRPPPQAR